MDSSFIEPDITTGQVEKCKRCCVARPRILLLNCSSCGDSYCFGFINHWKDTHKQGCDPKTVRYVSAITHREYTYDEAQSKANTFSNPENNSLEDNRNLLNYFRDSNSTIYNEILNNLKTRNPQQYNQLIKKVIIPAIELGATVTSSSEYDPSHSHHRILLNKKSAREGVNCWSAASNDPYQWVQISFNFRIVKVVKIATQGVEGHPQWIKQYKITYFDGEIWREYNNGEIFQANIDSTTVTYNNIHIEAYAIRIIPITWNAHISMRCEVYVDIS